MRLRLQAFACLLLLGCLAPAWAQATLRIGVVSNDFVLPGKVAGLDALAADSGVRFVHLPVDPTNPEQLELQGYDLLILDTPRPSDVAEVEQALGTALQDAALPWVRVGGGAPASAGLERAVAMRIAGYYAGGGAANFSHLARYLMAVLRGGGDAAAVPAPVALPATGYYHPQATAVFDTAAGYAQWRIAHPPAQGPRGSAAILLAPGAVAGLQTATVDALIEAAARRGVEAFGLWFDAADPQGLTRALAGLDVDALVNLTHLQNVSARAAEFEQLDVPVLQALGWRQGTPAQWRAASTGVPASLVPTFVGVPESWGGSDPLVIGAVEQGTPVPIPEQIDLLAAKLARLAALRRTDAAGQRVAMLFWNYPAGETNLSASHLNVPRSVVAIADAMRAQGYRIDAADEDAVIADGQAMLAGLYRPETLDALRARDLAGTLPLARYRQWLRSLPAAQRDAVVQRHGAPEASPALRTVDGERVFVLPRRTLGGLVLMPQPPRGARAGESSHDLDAVPDHRYLASYLYLREGLRADALIHLGTHGTQEWTPGKDRGLWAFDWPMLLVGDLPVFYPYIQDNVGEAVQAKRRGRAVTVSHQVPPFAPAGLYDELQNLHALLHELMQLDEGGVRARTADALVHAAFEAGIGEDLGWTRAAALGDLDTFLAALHDQLHELARATTPLGLHTFGQPADPALRISTVMQQLGTPYYEALGLDADELFADEADTLQRSLAWRWLHDHLHGDRVDAPVDDPALQALLARAREAERALADPQEIESLMRGLAGGFVPPGTGGDPVRDPTLRAGRNLYPFDPERIPTRAAFDAGGEALAQLAGAYAAEHGRAPEKLAFSLWSSEAMRQMGVLEAQVLHALGLRPVWDDGGRVTALEILPDAELAQPRIDVVLQVTSVYRDQFDGFMRLLAGAIDRLADQGEHALARNVRARADALVASGIAAGRARELAALRIFGNAPGEYGSGFNDRVLDEDPGADKSDATLATTFLSNLQYAYGARDWGVRVEGGNLFAEQLRGTDAAVLSRSSNTHGVLSTDHPFEYLGGLATAVRHLDGRDLSLYIADTRQAQPRMVAAARFLADELRSRQLNPQWIASMQAEGYAGTLQVLDTVNNLYGWQTAAPTMVRDAQWQALHDTYVRDVRNLGIDDWFERANPAAQAQMIRRMQDAIARGLWQADAATRRELDARLAQLQQAMSTQRQTTQTAAPDGAVPAAGYGTAPVPAMPAPGTAAAADAGSTATEPASPSALPSVRGRVLEQIESPDASAPGQPWAVALGLLLLVLATLSGAWRYRARQSSLAPATRSRP